MKNQSLLKRVNSRLTAVLNKAEIETNLIVYITSGFRTHEENDRLIKAGMKASPTSLHLTGNAVDFIPNSIDFFKIAEYFKDRGFKAVVYNDHIHIDTAEKGVFLYEKSLETSKILRKVQNFHKNLVKFQVSPQNPPLEQSSPSLFLKGSLLITCYLVLRRIFQ